MRFFNFYRIPICHHLLMYFSHHLIGIKLFPIFGFYISFQNNPFFYIIYIIFKVSILCSTTTFWAHIILFAESKMPKSPKGRDPQLRAHDIIIVFESSSANIVPYSIKHTFLHAPAGPVAFRHLGVQACDGGARVQAAAFHSQEDSGFPLDFRWYAITYSRQKIRVPNTATTFRTSSSSCS